VPNTSAQQRALELRDSLQKGMTDDNVATPTPCAQELTAKPIAKSLCPLTIDELRDEIGACCHTAGDRASDKGFLPMSVADYLELLDWTARQIRADKRGATPATTSRIFERLGIDAEVWCGTDRLVNNGRPAHACGNWNPTGKRRLESKIRLFVPNTVLSATLRLDSPHSA
jgi:hypothetical protein